MGCGILKSLFCCGGQSSHQGSARGPKMSSGSGFSSGPSAISTLPQTLRANPPPTQQKPLQKRPKAAAAATTTASGTPKKPAKAQKKPTPPPPPPTSQKPTVPMIRLIHPTSPDQSEQIFEPFPKRGRNTDSLDNVYMDNMYSNHPRRKTTSSYKSTPTSDAGFSPGSCSPYTSVGNRWNSSYSSTSASILSLSIPPPPPPTPTAADQWYEKRKNAPRGGMRRTIRR